ncbi:MAG: (2Fe-2S)-binding protein [Pseudomonadales bacterium]
MQIEFKLNGQNTAVSVEGSTPLLWVIRDTLGLTGTKYGCGMAQCGCCTVHFNGVATKSCVLPISEVQGKEVTTIEGLSNEEKLHPVQDAWIEKDVAQCGYCQAGQIMSASHLIDTNPSPSDEEIEQAMMGNICRCGTYNRIKEAINYAVEIKKNQK